MRNERYTESKLVADCRAFTDEALMDLGITVYNSITVPEVEVTQETEQEVNGYQVTEVTEGEQGKPEWNRYEIYGPRYCSGRGGERWSLPI